MQGAIIFAGIVTLIITFIVKYTEGKNEEEAEARRTARKEAESKLPPKQDVESDILYALRELNCCPECYSDNEDDDTVKYIFEYQGEEFALIVGNSVTTKIYDPCWYVVHKEDVDRYAECRRIINEMNIKYIGYTLYYQDDIEKQTISICTTNLIFVSKDHNKLVENLKHILHGYFTIQHEFKQRMMQAGLD